MTSTPLELRYYQKQAVNDFFEYTANNWEKHPIMVLPTGSGKSLVQAHIVKRMLDYPNTRILLITHQQLLIQQNCNELIENFQNYLFLDVGVYSAGLKSRETKNRILFAGIQSVYKKAWELGFFDIILCDECHLINPSGDGMYREFFAEMVKINPKVVIGGLSATEYRLKHGLLTEGKDALFDDVCHTTTVSELIDPNHYKNYDKTQYLCNLISKNGTNKVDLSRVSIRGKEYATNEMQKAFVEDDLVAKAVKEIKEYTVERKKVLVFTAGISHCEDVVNEMKLQGMDARCVHSKQSNKINEQTLIDFKAKKFKYLINVNSLTTGFNEKGIDCIVLLRSTLSPGLYYQMCGRGFRLHPDKIDCLILDFGRNIERHGPIDKIEVRKKKDGSGSEIITAPQKECPKCQALIPISVMICETCGYEFPVKDKHDETASEADILSQWKKPEVFEVEDVYYSRHQKMDKPDSLRVDYSVGMMESYSEWVCLEHEGFAKRKANSWIKERIKENEGREDWRAEGIELTITNVQEALDNQDFIKKPNSIIVNLNDKFPKITGYIFEDETTYQDRIKNLKTKKDIAMDNFMDDIPF